MRTAGTTTPPRNPLQRPPLRGDRGDPGQRVEIALRVAQVPDRRDDLPVLDQERPVAGHAGHDRELRVDGVRVVEAGHEEPAVQAGDEVVARGRAGGHDHVQRERAPGVRGGQPVAGRSDAVAGGGLRVVDDLAADPGVDERDALLRDALVVERHRQAGGVEAVIGDRHEFRADPLPGLDEAAVLLDGLGAEPEIAEHVEQVDDRVLLEDHRVVAGVDGDRVRGRARLLRRFPADRGRVDGRAVDGGRLRVAGPAVRPHRHGQELRDGPRPALAGAVAVGDGHRLRAGRERAVGGHPGRIGRRDDLADPVGARLGARIGGGRAVAGVDVLGLGRSGEPAPVLELLDDPGDRRGALGEPSQALVVGPPGRRHADALPDDEPQVHDSVGLGDVLVDLAVGEAGQRGVLGHDQRLGLGRALALRVGERGFGQAQRVLGAVVDHRAPAAAGRRPLAATTCRPRPGRPGTGRPGPRGRRGRPARARPCRSWACRASRSSTRRRPRRTSARTRR